MQDQDAPAMPPVSAIQAAVCQHFRVSPIFMASPSRRRSVARPRQIAMYLACELTILSLPSIGRQFGRDHTTVIHARKTIATLLGRDHTLASAVATLWRELSGQQMTPQHYP